MAIATEKVEVILKSKFDIEKFKELVKEIFSDANIISNNIFIEEKSRFKTHIDSYSQIANYTTPDDKKISIFAIKLNTKQQVENARSLQRNFAQKLLTNGNFDAALIAFFGDNESTWRLSLVCIDYSIKVENGKTRINENLTPARRYSYLVGEAEPCHTAVERLHKFIIDNNSKPTLDELEEAFSVESVTKEFFNKYCEKFYELVECLEKNEDFKLESEKCNFTSEQFAKKLMGQIVFLYFLQKKGWLGVSVWVKTLTEKEFNNVYYAKGVEGKIIKEWLPKLYVKNGDVYERNVKTFYSLPQDAEKTIADKMPMKKKWGEGSKKFLRDVFNNYKRIRKDNENFFNDYLEPLFYESLNTNRGSLSYSTILHCRIPFLSGGLFDPLDNYDWKNSNFHIPDDLFSNADSKDEFKADGILDIFDRYNFTMAEDEPMEHEVAIDPEMLGKVFENLLDIKDRKSKGAFYTPREIVNYMCEESLINYLSSNIDVSEDDLRDFVLYGDSYKDLDTNGLKGTKDKSGNIIYTKTYNEKLKIPASIFDISKNINRLNEIDNLLKQIRVADPAVGSGAFPLGMLNLIVRTRQNITPYIIAARNDYDKRLAYMTDRSTYALKYETIKNCIFAADIMPSAVDIARLRLWLSLVIDDELSDDELYGHRNPLPLPNLECNIVCGNSLVDEFKGYKLIPTTSELGTDTNGAAYSLFQSTYEHLIPKLIEVQNQLFNCNDTVKKIELIDKLNKIKDEIICTEFTDNIKEEYEKIKNQPSKPFVLWQLDFAKVFNEKGGFDVVIGNPPYIDSEEMTKSMPEERVLYQHKFKCAKGNWDIYICFFEKGITCLNKNGNIIYITPDKWISKSFGDALRIEYINNLKSILVAGRDVFDTALVDSIITQFTVKNDTKIEVLEFEDNKKNIKKVRTIEKTILSKPYALDILFSESIFIIEKLEKFEKLSKSFLCENACATSACYDLKTILVDLSEEKDFNDSLYYKVINTGTIGRYKSKWGISEMKYLKDKYKYPVVKKDLFHNMFSNTYGTKAKKKKIIIKGLTLLDNCIDFDGNIVPGKSTMIISSDNKNDLKVLSAYINSKLPIFYIKQKFSSSSYNGGINFSKDMIDDLPWIKLNKKEYDLVVNLVDEILYTDSDEVVIRNECIINDVFIKAFDLNEEEKLTILK